MHGVGLRLGLRPELGLTTTTHAWGVGSGSGLSLGLGLDLDVGLGVGLGATWLLELNEVVGTRWCRRPWKVRLRLMAWSCVEAQAQGMVMC